MVDVVKLSVNLPATLHEALVAEAKERGLAIADLLREGAKMYFEAKESREPFVDIEVKELVKLSMGFWGFDADKLLKLAKERKLLGDGLWTDERLLLLKPIIDRATEGLLPDYERTDLLAKVADGLGVDRVRLDAVMSPDFAPSVENPSEVSKEDIDGLRDELMELKETVDEIANDLSVLAEKVEKAEKRTKAEGSEEP